MGLKHWNQRKQPCFISHKTALQIFEPGYHSSFQYMLFWAGHSPFQLFIWTHANLPMSCCNYSIQSSLPSKVCPKQDSVMLSLPLVLTLHLCWRNLEFHLGVVVFLPLHHTLDSHLTLCSAKTSRSFSHILPSQLSPRGDLCIWLLCIWFFLS